MGIETGVDLYKVLDCGDIAEQHVVEVVPTISSMSVVSGLAGVFSGFTAHVKRVGAEYNVDPRHLVEVGRRRVVAGQEDMVIEVALKLAGREPAGVAS